jgi:hypothetical protein
VKDRENKNIQMQEKSEMKIKGLLLLLSVHDSLCAIGNLTTKNVREPTAVLELFIEETNRRLIVRIFAPQTISWRRVEVQSMLSRRPPQSIIAVSLAEGAAKYKKKYCTSNKHILR